jgi:23S rRNA (adenine2030-N6)-methyltransferase
MFSYRHGFHAGNHADVLKHLVLVHLLRHMCGKEIACMYIDTHAGAGIYELNSGFAAKNAEYESGIAKIWKAKGMGPALREYVELVQAFNPQGKLSRYPGSPFIAAHLLREQDRLRLFEMHSTEGRVLNANCSEPAQGEAAQLRTSRGKRVMVRQEDGFEGLKSLLPPPSRRALVLIDPSYEDKDDYRNVTRALADALGRFATGTYAVWYPLLQRLEARRLQERLKKLPASEWLDVTLTVGAPSPDGFGLRGSGMFILNPPWTLEAVLRELMPELVQRLAIDDRAGYTLEKGSAAAERPQRRAPASRK